MEIAKYGERTRQTTKTLGKSRTHQSMAKACDINGIMKKYENSGIISHTSTSPPFYGDFSNATDYLTACNRVLDAEASFATLPSKVREQMHNDPGQLYDFMADPKNADECVQLGLFEAPPPPQEAPPENPPPPAEPPPETPPESA